MRKSFDEDNPGQTLNLHALCACFSVKRKPESGSVRDPHKIMLKNKLYTAHLFSGRVGRIPATKRARAR